MHNDRQQRQHSNQQATTPGQTGSGIGAGGGSSGKLRLAQAFEFRQRIVDQGDQVPYETAGLVGSQQKVFAWCQPITAGNLNGDWTIYVLEALPGTGTPSDIYQYAAKLTTVEEAERFLTAGHGGIMVPGAVRQDESHVPGAIPTS